MPRQLLRAGGDQCSVMERLYEMGAGDPVGLTLHVSENIKGFYPSLLKRVFIELSEKGLIVTDIANQKEVPGILVKITSLGLKALKEVSLDLV